MNTAADHSKEKDFGLAGVWMLPILILQMIFARFADRLDRLKRFRRTRPIPKNWRDHFGRLRQCEWHIQQLLANGARQVLAFGDVDLNAIPMIVDVPDDFAWAEPRTASALHIRMQGLARFHADPGRYIHRHAERIAALEAEAASPAAPAPVARRSGSIENTAPACYHAERIRGPPPSAILRKAAALVSTHSHSSTTSLIASARPRPHA